MGAYWFRPKRYGHGAAPANWKGWAAIAGYMAATGLILWPRILALALSGAPPDPTGIVTSMVILAIATLGFIWLCKVKTDGEWKWRWGDKD